MSYNSWTTLFCGASNNRTCDHFRYSANNYDLISAFLRSSVITICVDSTYCSPSCLAAITALEKYAGCCYANELNGPKVLCGQQPIPYCSTPVSRFNGAGSADAGISMITLYIAVIAASLVFKDQTLISS